MFQKGNQINKGRIPWNKDGTHTPEVRKKMSEIRKSKGTSPAQMEVLRQMSLKNIGNKYGVGKVKTEETKRKLSIFMKANPNAGQFKLGYKGRVGCVLSEETKEKIRQAHIGITTKAKGKKRPDLSGDKHWNWKGGVNPVNDTIRKSLEYKLWREAVYKRDGFACVVGGKAHGNKLNADHIKPFSWFPELRFAIDNGRTLCESCHRETDTFAGKALKHKPQVIEANSR